MRRTITLASVSAVLALSMFGVHALAEDTAGGEKGKEAKAQQRTPLPMMGCRPGCGMRQSSAASAGGRTADPAAGRPRWMKTAQEAGITPGMMRHCRMMMSTPLVADSPSGICGQAAILGLSEEQKKELIEIEKEANKEALAVLTPEQREKLGGIPAKPVTMMQMCQQMCARMAPLMRKTTSDKGGPGPMMMCPMMHMMRGESAPTDSGAKPQGSGPKQDK